MAGGVLLSSFILLTIFNTALVSAQSCAEIKLIPECSCLYNILSKQSVGCTGLTQPSQVRDALVASKNTNTFNILNSILPSLPLDLYSESVKYFNLIRTNLAYISPPNEVTRSAFDGLKNLESLLFVFVTGIPNWDWTKLRNVPKMRSLQILHSKFPRIPKEFSEIGQSNLEVLYLVNNSLESIADGALAFPKLTQLYIHDQQLDELRTEMFHKNNKIEKLLIRDMELKTISENFFNSMKNLKTFETDSHLLNLFNEQHFRDVKLDIFTVADETKPAF